MEKMDVLEMLREAEDIYVIYSACTNMPFVYCDPETYDDEVILFDSEEEAKKQADRMLDAKIPVRLVNVKKEHRLEFFTGLFPMGVNCILVCTGEEKVQVQLNDLVIRTAEEDLPEDEPRIENPELHLTALYFVQELRRNPEEMTEEMDALNEEMMAHFYEGKYLVAVQEDNQIPALRRTSGKVYQPIFTDLMEFVKFDKEQKYRALIMDAETVAKQLPDGMEGVAINPFGVNVLLDISKSTASEPATGRFFRMLWQQKGGQWKLSAFAVLISFFVYYF